MESLDVEAFIIEIERRPVIWDMGCSEYTNRKKKNIAWDEVVDIFSEEGATEEEKRLNGQLLLRRWKSLRDSYGRELRLQKKKSTSGSRKRPTYVYFKQLSFLDSDVETQPVPDNQNSSKSTTPKESKSPILKRKLQDPVAERVSIEEKKVQLRQEKERESESDCDRMFLLSLLDPLKEIPEHARFGVKRQIMDLLDTELQFHRQTVHIIPVQH